MRNVSISDVNQFRYLLKMMKYRQDKITYLKIRSHGTVGSILIGTTMISTGSVSNGVEMGLKNGNVRRLIKDVFCPNAKIFLVSCYQGNADGTALVFKQILPMATIGAPTGQINAFTGYVTIFDWLFKGSTWVVVE